MTSRPNRRASFATASNGSARFLAKAWRRSARGSSMVSVVLMPIPSALSPSPSRCAAQGIMMPDLRRTDMWQPVRLRMGGGVVVPGRCPGLVCRAPLGLRSGTRRDAVAVIVVAVVVAVVIGSCCCPGPLVLRSSGPPVTPTAPPRDSRSGRGYRSRRRKDGRPGNRGRGECNRPRHRRGWGPTCRCGRR